MLHRVLWLTAAAALLLAAQAASANEARVLESGDDEILIELATDDYSLEDVSLGGESFVHVSAPRCVMSGDEGLPFLPMRSVLVGVPFGSDLSMEVVSTESENLGRVRVEPTPHEEIVRTGDISTPIEEFAIDEDYYARGGALPAVVAELGEQSTLRHQRVVPVFLHPFQYSGATGSLTLHKRIVVRISIAQTRRPDDLIEAVRIEPEWERVYDRSVLNHTQAAQWRMRSRPLRGVSGPRYGTRGVAYKLLTTEDGMHRVDFSELAAEGLDGTTPVDDVAIFQRSFERDSEDPFVETPVAIDVVDADEDGSFDGDDYLLFYAQTFEQQYMVVGYEDRYGDDNAYWFAEDPNLALRMGTRPGWLDETGLTAPSSFRDTLKFEEDLYFDRQPDYDYIDLYQWTRYQNNGDNQVLPFTLYDAHDGSTAVFRTRYQGMLNRTHNIDFRISYGDTADNYVGHFTFSGISSSMAENIYESGPFPSWYFTDGANSLRAIGGNGSAANLDWFEIEYDRDFIARERRLIFTNASESGESQFEVHAFSTDAIRLFDVTDPWGTSELTLDAANISGEEGDYTLTFQDDVAGFTRYEAAEPGGYHSVKSVERRESADLWSHEADVIVVSHEDFVSGVEPLVEHRESQGWVVTLAEVEEVYDEFGTGLKSLDPIKDYFGYAFDNWERTPQFAMLVGDASEDTKKTEPTSQTDYIPSVLLHGSATYPQIVLSDQWFIVARDGAPYYFPQMFLGRLSVGNATQLANVVSKILAYESYSPGQEWRDRTLFIADDQWAYGGEPVRYIWNVLESEFTTGSIDLAEIVASSPADIDTTMFMLRRYTNPFNESNGVEPGETQPYSYFATEVYPYVRGTVTPQLLDQLNQGAALVNFQGHGNRGQMTHEALLLTSHEPALDDIGDMDNAGRPFIFLGFSCHLAEFALYTEGAADGTECIVENMLFLPSARGAVAGFACTGAAYRTQNVRYNTSIFEAFFDTPTPEGDPSDFFWPRWTLGSILGQGTIDYVSGYVSSVPTRTYVLLGDPLLRLAMSPPKMQVTVNDEPILSGEYLESSEGEDVTFVVDIIDEVEIDPATIVVEDRGEVVGDEFYTVEAVSDTLSEVGRWYRLTYETTIGDENNDIEFSATDMTGQRTTFVVHVAGNAAIRLRQVINHPNPFSDRTKIIYMLNQSGADVRIDIYTIGGRHIKTIDYAPGNLNYNEVEWDGVDDDGDPVANGVYLYVVEAKGEDGTTATSDVGRMVVMRGSRSDRR